MAVCALIDFALFEAIQLGSVSDISRSCFVLKPLGFWFYL